MADRLSELPDDLLRRVLHFTPLKEAASTTALSRRWRAPLWQSSGALNLVTCVESYGSYRRGDDGSSFLSHYRGNYRQRKEDEARFFYWRDAFLSEAVAALDAGDQGDTPITRLTLRLEFRRSEEVEDFLNRDRHEDGAVVSRDRNLVDVLLSHRASRRVEELRLVFAISGGYAGYTGYTVTLGTLPLETLRVLELTGCKGLYQGQAAAVVLPRLSTLRLSCCTQDLISLQHLIDAAPALAAIRLMGVHVYATDWWSGRLRCPAATVLVLSRCSWDKKTVDGVVIHAPRLRRFSYMGLLRSFSSSRPSPEFEQVDLHEDRWKEEPELDLATFWRLAWSFTSTKEMRLRVKQLEDVALLTEASRVQLLPSFRRLQRLQLTGAHWTKGDTAAVTIVNLLRCCPVLSTLRINLTAKQQVADAVSNKKGVRSRIPQKITQIPALGPHRSLECLQSSLKIVGLQFWLGESNCLGVKLTEYFAENARVLEEMHINGRDQKLCEHMNRQTER
ncbi:hypothetical protein ACQ4PT_070281 [Festuca glaucescens]